MANSKGQLSVMIGSEENLDFANSLQNGG